MTEQFIAKVTDSEKDRLKDICTDLKFKATEEDAQLYFDVIKRAATVWTEDQTEEAIRYIAFSVGGLRASDLQALIGQDWKVDTFEEFINALGFPLVSKRPLQEGFSYEIKCQPVRMYIMNQLNHDTQKSFTSDIAFHLLQLPADDQLRNAETMHLLLDAELPYEAAKYLSETEGDALRIATITVAQALKDAPEATKKCVFDMTETADTDQVKLFTLLLNDVMGIIGNPDLQLPLLTEFHNRLENIVRTSNSADLGILFGNAKLRLAQNARVHRNEKEAQATFLSALTGLMHILEALKPEVTTQKQINLIWLTIKICQEMAQPKAIVLLFDKLVVLEKALMEQEGNPELKDAMGEHIIGQYVDMSKLYIGMPQQLKEQFYNYAEPTIALLQAYLEECKKAQDAGEEISDLQEMKTSSYYQAIGELCMNNDRMEESYNALVEAQIEQERQLGRLIKQDGDNQMSPDQLMVRLALSVTNHMLGIHYRSTKKNSNDLKLVLETNSSLAKACYQHYPQDGRVIHFLINAALELADYQHASNSLVPEKETYLDAAKEIQKLQNLRIDEALCRDIALLHTKLGQSQMHFREYTEAQKNLNVSFQLWSQLFKNTQRPEFQKNADAVAEILKQIKTN